MDDKNKAKPEKQPEIINPEKIGRESAAGGTPEKINSPEIKLTPEKPAEFKDRPAEKSGSDINIPGSGGLAGISNQQKAGQARQKEVEKIMEENIEEIFISLPPERQAEFKLAGERTAAEINGLFEKGKATMKKIMDLVKKWLSILPGVNKFFLEQEAKIKADKILEMNDQ
ncbi:MAG: hypothetical protein WC745_04940 [Patescibacteria group bacterium]|jgi:hypothetical protein